MSKWSDVITVAARQEKVSLHLPRLPESLDGLRILLFGDLHSRGWGINEKRLCRAMRTGFDLLICAGDYSYPEKFYLLKSEKNILENQARYARQRAMLEDRAFVVLEKLFKDFDRPLGSWAVQGNHDTSGFMQRLPSLDINVLMNDSRVVQVDGGGQFNLCGLQCGRRTWADTCSTLTKLQPGLFTVGVCHYPEMAEGLAAANVDLILAGHTHGGQICLPGRIPIITHSRTGRKYSAGLETTPAGYSYTSRGLGYCLPAVRIFCPPELGFIILRRGNLDQTSITYKNIP